MPEGVQNSTSEQDRKAVARFLDVVGGIVIYVGGAPVVNGIITGTRYSLPPAVITCAIGVVLLVAGLFWHRIGPRFGDETSRSLVALARNAWSWYVILLLWLAYVAVTNTLSQLKTNNEILALRNDVQSIANVINRMVLPRHLTKQQQRAISGFLAQFEPHEYAFELSAYDREAGDYRGDIEQALMKGGWTRTQTNPYRYVENSAQEGLAFYFTETMEHAEKPPDPKNPTPDILLQEAFGLAGVRVEGTSHGSSSEIKQDLLVIHVGRAKRDRYELVPPAFGD